MPARCVAIQAETQITVGMFNCYPKQLISNKRGRREQFRTYDTTPSATRWLISSCTAQGNWRTLALGSGLGCLFQVRISQQQPLMRAILASVRGFQRGDGQRGLVEHLQPSLGHRASPHLDSRALRWEHHRCRRRGVLRPGVACEILVRCASECQILVRCASECHCRSLDERTGSSVPSMLNGRSSRCASECHCHGFDGQIGSSFR